MPKSLRHALVAAVVAVFGAFAAPALAQDTLVSVGSSDPALPFSQNKQNEPTVAVNPVNPLIVAAGSNDNIDMEACNAGPDDDCPFTPGVGVSGIYFSQTGGSSWTQPSYTGLTGRNCLGVVGDTDPECTPTTGPIGTLPNYYEAGLSSDGDPALAWGPVPGPNGKFSWSNGQRLYYANLTAPLASNSTFKGFEGIAVSHTDNATGQNGASSGNNAAWSAPVIASKQNAAQFSDKEQIWADNASDTSKYFGNVYVCYAQFRGNGGNGHGTLNQPLSVIVSRDGGNTWAQQQLTAAAINPNGNNGFGRSGCTVRTDSAGNVYLFDTVFAVAPEGFAAKGAIEMFKSTDGGRTWSKPKKIFDAYDTCNYFEASIGRCVEDGVGGARSDLSPAPSVDIANGAPTGGDATNRIVLTWVDGRDGLNHEHVMFTDSSNGGQSWTLPVRQVEDPGDRGYYSAPSISPNGTDVYLVYNAFTTMFAGTDSPHELIGVVKHADVSGSGVGGFTTVHRGVQGDARGSSQNNLQAEFLGDYVYASASRTGSAAVWNDTRRAADCPAIDAYRQALHDAAVGTGTTTGEAEEPRGESRGEKQAEADTGPQPPDVQQDCPSADGKSFGNTDIFGGFFADPTP